MTNKHNKWYVITGGPSTGKTTMLHELQKLGYAVVPEAARLVIDEGIAAGLSVAEIRKDEEAFQAKVLERKIAIESQQDQSVPTFFDRGMHDTLAYNRYYGYAISPSAEHAFHESHYYRVFLFEPLPVFERDYVRTESDDFPEHIYHLLNTAYSEYGMEPLIVPAMSVQERVAFVLNNIGDNGKVHKDRGEL